MPSQVPEGTGSLPAEAVSQTKALSSGQGSHGAGKAGTMDFRGTFEVKQVLGRFALQYTLSNTG